MSTPIDILENVKNKLETEISEIKAIQISNGVTNEQLAQEMLRYSPLVLLIWTHEDPIDNIRIILEGNFEVQVYVHECRHYTTNLCKCYEIHDKIKNILDGYSTGLSDVGEITYSSSDINTPLVIEGASVALKFKVKRKI